VRIWMWRVFGIGSDVRMRLYWHHGNDGCCCLTMLPQAFLSERML